MARVSLLSVEYSMCRPDERVGDPVFSTTFGRPVSQVPVLHLFGRAVGPQHCNDPHSACVHVHNVLPYFYVPRYDADVAAVQFGMQLESVAIHCLRLPTTSRLLHHVAVVSAVPFYGYHGRPKAFFKVFVYQPAMVSKLANLLGSSSNVGGRQWQPYEAHIPYHFQFMVDYGLTGTGVVEVLGATVRRPLPQPRSNRTDDDGGSAAGAPAGQPPPSRGSGGGMTSASPASFEAGATLPDGCTLASEAWDLEKTSTAAVEMDTTPDCLPPCTTPGSSLNGVKRGLREYLVERGLGMRVLVDAVAPFAGRYGSVAMAQSLDPMVPWMRNLAARYVAMRAATLDATPSMSASDATDHCLPPATMPLHALLARPPHASTSTTPRHSVPPAPDCDDDTDDCWRPSATFHMLDLIAAAEDVPFGDDADVEGATLVEALPPALVDAVKHTTPAASPHPSLSCDSGGGATQVVVCAEDPTTPAVTHENVGEEVDLFDEGCDRLTARTPSAAASPLVADEGKNYFYFCLPRSVVGGCEVRRGGATQSTQLNLIDGPHGEQLVFGRCLGWRECAGVDDGIFSGGRLPDNRPTATSSTTPATLVVQWYVTVADTPWRHETKHLERRRRLHPHDVFLTDVCDVVPVDAIAKHGRSVCMAGSLEEWQQHTQQQTGVRQGVYPGGVWLCRHRFRVATQTLHPLLHPTEDPHSVLLVLPEVLTGPAARPPPSFHHDALPTSSDDDDAGDVANPASRVRRAGSAAAVVAATQLAREQTRIMTVEDVCALDACAWSTPQGGRVALGDNDAQQGDARTSTTHVESSCLWSVERVAFCATQRCFAGDAAAAASGERPTLSAEHLSMPSLVATPVHHAESSEPTATSHHHPLSGGTAAAASTATTLSTAPEAQSLKRQRVEADDRSTREGSAPTGASATSPPPRPAAAIGEAPHNALGSNRSVIIPVDTTTTVSAVPNRYALVAAVGEDQLQQQHASVPQRFALCGLDNPMRMAATDATHVAMGPMRRPSAPLLTTVTQRYGSARNDRQRGGMARRRRPLARKAPSGLSAVKPTVGTAGSSGGGASRMPYLSQACIEVLADAGATKSSDAAHNPVLAVAIALTTTHREHTTIHYFILSAVAPHHLCSLLETPVDLVEAFTTEGALLARVHAFLMRCDPDILTSWDCIRGGLGYLAERARVVLRMDLLGSLGRLLASAQPQPFGAFGATWGGPQGSAGGARLVKEEEDVPPSQEEDPEAREPGNFAPRSTAVQPTVRRNATMKVQGRIVLHLAKVSRSELKQTSYTLQACYQSLFGVPLPHYTDAYLADAFHRGLRRPPRASAPSPDGSGAASMGRFVLHVLRDKVLCPLRVARHLDLVVRTSELAQLYGILFMEVLGRGSQYRVESFMLRFAKPRGYVAVSPSREQVMLQNRQEGIALVMEPYSGFYTDPVVVLDFRSLYPSMVIAYNLCYSTCLGKVSKDREVKLGAMACYKTPHRTVAHLLPHDDRGGGCGGIDKDRDGGPDAHAASSDASIAFAPTSCMFVQEGHRQGILPEMLDQILSTRFQVQAVMKLAAAEGDDVTRRVLDAQQLGLKLLANVTYGYAAATFSGRMPCSDIADSIVLLGRQTLERAIRLIEGHPTWRAKVVYGDTDSLFIHLPGRTKAQAFDIAEAMAAAVTAANPHPVTLKFEKVYQPCLMVTKKRYVGYAWETRGQTEPRFDAKGIEAIRRDQCAATSRIQESLLRCLFDSHGNLERLRQTFEAHVMKFVRHDINPTDVILRREVKLGTYAKESTLPPAARVALQKIQRDSASAPLYGERVPYVVLTGASERLMDLVEDPLRVLQRDVPFAINVAHYMEKHILPSLERVFHLVDVDVRKWYAAMPRQTVSRSALFSVRHIRWQVPGLDAQIAGERAASRCIEDLGAATPGASTGSSGRGGGQMGGFAPTARCAVCSQRPSSTHSWLPPVCRECLKDGPQHAASVATVSSRKRIVEGELRRLADRCTQCAWTRLDATTPADLEALLAPTASDAVSAGHQLDAGFAVDRGTACVPALGACVSLDCAQTFQVVRARELLHQLSLLEDFLQRCFVVASEGGIFRSDDGAPTDGTMHRTVGVDVTGGHPPRFTAKPLGAKERPLHVD